MSTRPTSHPLEGTPEPLTLEQRFQRNLAGHAQEQDLYKHLATLSTGSIVLLATFAEKFSSRPQARGLLVTAFVAFICSVVGVVVMQALSVLNVERHPDDERFTGGAVLFLPTAILAFGGFLTGIISLAVFAIKNL